MKNPVAKNLYTFNKPSVVLSNKHKKQSKAALREMSETLLNDAVEPQTVTFENGSVIWWDESEDGCESVLNSVGCSSIEIEPY